MTAAVAPTPAAGPATAAGRVTQARVVASEWIKLRSLRSTLWTLLVAVVLTIGLGALISAVANNDVGRRPGAVGVDGLTTSLAGTNFAQLAIGVLGVLVISGEYGTGMIRSSLTVVPRRLPVLWAKLAVFAAVVFPLVLVTEFVSFFLGQVVVGERYRVALGDPGVLRSVIGAALYVTVVGLIAVAVGTLLRHTAGAISAVVGVFFVLPPLTLLLPNSWQSHITPYLPSNAGEQLWETNREQTYNLSPWAGFGVLCIYAVVLIALAAWRLERSDA